MFKWLNKWLKTYNEVEAENLRAGIINVTHPFMGTYTYIDKETYEKYINDKQRTVSRDYKQSKVKRKV